MALGGRPASRLIPRSLPQGTECTGGVAPPRLERSGGRDLAAPPPPGVSALDIAAGALPSPDSLLAPRVPTAAVARVAAADVSRWQLAPGR